MNRLIAFFVDQGLFANLLTILIIGLGIFSTKLIPREVFPSVNFDIVSVTTVLPGAAPETVEKLITNPLEQVIKEVDGIKKMTSVTSEGLSVIVVQVDPDQTTGDECKTDIQDVVDGWADAPDGAEDSKITLQESKLEPIVQVSIVGEDSELERRKLAKTLEREFEAIKGVAKADYKGLRDYEIKVHTSPQKLKAYDLSIQDLLLALKNNNINIPGGIINPSDPQTGREMIIRSVGELETLEDIEETVIRANTFAKAIKIKDVATVSLDFAKAQINYRVNSSPTTSLTVLKKEKGDAVDLVDNVKEIIARWQPRLKPGVSLELVNDTSYFIRRRISVLMSNLVIGFGLVILILSLFLPMSVSMIVALGVPFAFMGTMLFFNLTGNTINLISLMGLIIVVGMLVDDAIVTVENAQAYVDKGYTPREAAIKGTQEIWLPILASVFTTVTAFAPMMFMSGIFGKFIRFIPIGVIVALLVSLVECYFILPHHFARWMGMRNKGKPRLLSLDRVWMNWIAPSYSKVIGGILRLRYFIVIGALGFFVASVFFAKNNMKFILFPPGNVEAFKININTPVGTTLDETERRILPIEAVIKELPKNELLNYETKIGIQRVNNGDGDVKRGGEYGQIVVFLTQQTERTRTAFDIIDDLRERIGTPPGITKVNFGQISGGPPTGKPINVAVRGDDYREMRPAVEKLKQYIAEIPGAMDIEDTFTPGKEEIHVKIRAKEAAAAQLNAATIGTTVRAAFDGLIATKIRRVDEEIDVRVSLEEESTIDENTLSKIKIPNPMGFLVPLSQVSELSKHPGIANYEHENNRRQVRAVGEIDTNATSATEVSKQIMAYLPSLRQEYPNLEFAFGGEVVDTNESLQSLATAFIIALVGITMILILTFQNLLQTFVVVSTIPLGIASVVWTLYFHKQPLSFMAMVGIIALGGVIVNNAIVMVDFTNQAKKAGVPRLQAVQQAAVQRLRPIFLTTLTTVVGILPTAYGIGGLDPFVVPVALSLGWGLGFGAFLTSIVFPANLAIIEDLTQFAERMYKRFFSKGSAQPDNLA